MKDYTTSGLSIQMAMLEAHRAYQASGGPLSIYWGGKLIQTGDVLLVPQKGLLRVEILKVQPGIRQGFDLKLPGGGCVLANGSIQEHLRTYFEPDLDNVIEYAYVAPEGSLKTWNVYDVERGAHTVAEMWTGNAGFWIEDVGVLDRIYHCSHGRLQRPNFEAFVYRLTVSSSGRTLRFEADSAGSARRN